MIKSVLLLIPLLLFLGDQPKQPEIRMQAEFTFLRLVYSGSGWMGEAWAVDYPKADEQFLYALRKLTDFGFVNTKNRALPLSDAELFQYPFLYAVEVGYMELSRQEADRLREYLLRGGFLVVDDFHGEYEWQHFYRQMKKVLPEYEPFELSVSHPIFIVSTILKSSFRCPVFSFSTAEELGRREATGPAIWVSRMKKGV